MVLRQPRSQRAGRQQSRSAAETSSPQNQTRKHTSPMGYSSQQPGATQMRSPSQRMQRQQQTQSRQPPPGVSNSQQMLSPNRMQRPPLQQRSPQQSTGQPSSQQMAAASRPPQSPQSQQPPDMDQMRMLAYQQRQQKRKNRIITPSMLKARPVEIKQNVVMRSKHQSSTGSVTSDTSFKSDMTEKATNLKARMRKKAFDIEKLDTLESVETFESLKNDAENKMALANALLAEASEAKKKAKLEIAEEKNRLKAAEDERKKAQQDELEMQQLVMAQAAEDRKRYEAIEKKLAAEAEEKRKAHEEAEERIAKLEAEQKRLDQEHKAALAEAQKQAKLAAEEEKLRQDLEKQRSQLEEQLRIASLKEEEESQNLEAEEKRQAQEEAVERIKIMEAEQKRLDQEHKAALAEAQKQARIAAKEEKHRLEVQKEKQLLEEQLRIEVEGHEEIARATKKRFFKLSAAEADEKRKAQADAAERIGMLEAKHRRLNQEHKAALAEAQRLTKIAANEEKSRLEVEQQRLQLEEKMQNELVRYAQIAAEEEEWRLKAAETGRKLEEEMYRQAQIAADEGMKRLEAESKRLELEEEAQRQAQIAVAEGKKRLEAEQMRVKLEARLLELESETRATEQEKQSRKWYDVRRLGSGRQAAEANKIKSALNKLTLEGAYRKGIPHTHSYSGFFVSEGVSDCSSEEEGDIIISESSPQEAGEKEEEEGDLREAVEVEMPISQKPNNLDTVDDYQVLPADKSVTNEMKSKVIGSTSFDVGRLMVRHQVSRESPSVYSTPVIPSLSKKVKKQSTTKSEVPNSQESNNLYTIEDSWTRLGDKSVINEIKKQPKTKSSGLKSLWSKSANHSVKEEPEHERSHDGSTSGKSELVSETIRELASEQGSDWSDVESENLKLLDQACLQVEEKIELTKNEIRQASSQGAVAGSVRKDKVKKENDSKSVPRLDQLELELKELFNEIAKKKDEAARLLNESKRESKSDSSYDNAIQRGAGKAVGEMDGMEYFGTIHEHKEPKGTEIPARMSDYQMEEGIEVMPTLSDTEVISVNTPLSIDESAFALQTSNKTSNQRTSRNVNGLKKAQQDELEKKQLVMAQAAEERKRYEAIEKKLAAEAEAKRKAHAEAEERIAKLEDEQKRLDQEHTAALAEAQKQAKVAANEKNKARAEAEERIAILEAEQKRLEQEHTAALVEAQKQAKLAVNHLHEFVEVESGYGADGEQYDDPAYDKDVAAQDAMAYEEEDVDEFVERRSLPDKFIEIPARRVPVRRDDYPRTNRASVQIDNIPRKVMSPREKGPRQIVSPKKSSFLERAAFLSTHACAGGSQAVFACGDPCGDNKEDINESYNPLELERARMDENSRKYYNVKSPPTSSIIRNAKYDYSQVEQDRATRAYVNVGEQNARDDIAYSARRQPRKQSKNRVKYNEIMSVDGRYVNATELAKERRDRERVPRNLELTPRARTPRGGHQEGWREEVASPREDRWEEDVARPGESRTMPRSGHQQAWREEVDSPRESRGEEWGRRRGDRVYYREELPKQPKKKGLGQKMFGGMKKLAKARIVYDN